MIYENVERIREARGITKVHISKALGYKTIRGYCYLVSGDTDIPSEKLKIIANIFGVDPSVFFDDRLTESVINSINKAS